MTVTVNGQRKQKYFYGKTKAEVLRKIAEYKREEKPQAKSRAFELVADDWWEEAQEDLSPNTRRPYKAALNRAREHFKGREITSITPADVNAFLRLMVKKNRMAEKTAKTQLSVCNMIFRHAVRAGDILFNPARDLEIPSKLEHNPRGEASPEDIRLVLDNCQSQTGQMALWFLCTGLRRSELLALTWDDVDLEKRIITVNKSLVRDETGRVYAKEPKTEAGVREVPIIDALAQHITPGKGLVFPNAEGNYITENAFSRRWSNYQKATGISCTPHQLRHSMATTLCEAVADGKISLEDMQHIIGHAQYQTTMDIYNHYRESRKERAFASIFSLDVHVENPVQAPEPL